MPGEAAPEGPAASLLAPLLASLTLGLAPFSPEPHVVEKLRWVWEGAAFRPIDGFDLLLHGAPWVWLAVALGGWARSRAQS